MSARIDDIRASMRDRMWSVVDIAAFMGRSLTVAKLVVSQPGFPSPVRLWSRSHPMWIERQVRDWIEAHQQEAA